MKNKYLLMFGAIGLIGLSFFKNENKITNYHVDGIESIQSSEDPPVQRTGAPGEGNCTSCHSGIVNTADGVVEFTKSGGPGYMPGTSYAITLSSADGFKNGFELVMLDESNDQAGSFTAGPNTSILTASGRQYIRHSESTGLTSWDFTWQAPELDMGELTAYYSVVKANNNGTSSGDEVFLGSESLAIFGTDIKENKLDKAYNVSYSNQTNELKLDYLILDKAKVLITVRDLSGRLTMQYDFGNQTPGDYKEVLVMDELKGKGIYVVSLFINNQVFNRKVFLG